MLIRQRSRWNEKWKEIFSSLTSVRDSPSGQERSTEPSRTFSHHSVPPYRTHLAIYETASPYFNGSATPTRRPTHHHNDSSASSPLCSPRYHEELEQSSNFIQNRMRRSLLSWALLRKLDSVVVFVLITCVRSTRREGSELID